MKFVRKFTKIGKSCLVCHMSSRLANVFLKARFVEICVKSSSITNDMVPSEFDSG